MVDKLDKVVVGVQVDNLEGMDKFGGREATVAYPHWKQDLKNRVKFECYRSQMRQSCLVFLATPLRHGIVLHFLFTIQFTL